jgi:hypothetical protein
MLFGFGNRRAEPAPAIVAEAEAVAARVEGKALSPDKTARMPGNKRDRERVPLEGHVRGEVMVFQPMTILDISIAGAQIETAFALQLESLHDFRLSLADRSVVVKGRVAHCHIGELTDEAAYYKTGIEFVDLSDHARSAINDFVLAMKYAQSSPTVVDGEIAGSDRSSED